jgi:hypothetical protein
VKATHHINYLETTAGFFAPQAFFKRMSNIHVGLELDNTTVVTYINKMGGNKSNDCNRAMWQLCGVLSIIFAWFIPYVVTHKEQWF